MRKYLYILASVALLFASCGKDSEFLAETESLNTIAFTYKSHNIRTYAGIALNPEKVVRDIDIFAFSGGTFVKQLVKNTDYTETVVGSNTTLTLTQDFVEPHTGNFFVFYFIANNAASNTGTENDGQKHIASFSGTEAQFVETLTLALGDSPYYLDGSKSEILTIDPLAGGMLMTGKCSVRLFGKKTASVTLKRRVARFDIVNPVPDKFNIDNIYLSEAPLRGAVFAESATTPTITNRSIEPLGVVPFSAYDAGGRAAAVFYLYPTDLATTKITIEGWFADPSETYLFEVVGTLDITANKRYTLIFDESQLKFTAGVGDWDEL